MRPTVSTLLSCALRIATGVAGQSPAADAYAPSLQPCPSGTSLIRNVGPNARTQTLSAGEAQYVFSRQSRVLPREWAEYLANVQSSTHVALPGYVDVILLGTHGKAALPTLAIATSGGGHRAAIFGAGVLNTLDGRNQTSARVGLGGLLQSTTYLSGLSGGSWLVGSLSQANLPLLPDLVFGASQSDFGGWITQVDLVHPGPTENASQAYIGELLQEIAFKWVNGFPVTVTDVWGRALARHFVNGTTSANVFDNSLTHGAGITLSSIATLSTFANFAQPFPIMITNSLSSHSNRSSYTESGDDVPLANTIYEFNVFETGSFDPALGAFTPTQFLGSPNNSVCATGFDQLSFIEGTSSTTFNEFNVTGGTLAGSPVGPIIGGIQQLFPQNDIRLDSAAIPNPFFGVSTATFADSDQALLTLVDGGEDGEVTPFQPLLVQARSVDTIIAIDAPADTADNWAAGLSLIATQDRAKLFPLVYSFPSVPLSSTTFLAENLTRRPTFFGCRSSLSSGEPLVIYIANGGPPLGQSPLTNTSTTQLQYPTDEVQAMLNQVFDVATQGIPTEEYAGPEKDPQWSACLACAVVDRARRNLGIVRSGVCKSCLDRYCWS